MVAISRSSKKHNGYHQTSPREGLRILALIVAGRRVAKSGNERSGEHRYARCRPEQPITVAISSSGNTSLISPNP
jgi:hypothetical protein